MDKVRILLATALSFYFMTICQAQTIYISSNIAVKFRIVVDHTNDKTVSIIPGKYVKLECGKLLEVWYSDSNHVTQYAFENTKFKDNDTLNLNFTFYHSVDTSYYTSGCLDGSYPVNRTSTKEY